MSITKILQVGEEKKMTRTGIYRAAIKHFKSQHGSLNPHKHIASRLGITPKHLYAIVPANGQEGKKIFRSVVDEEIFFQICGFPQGFQMKSQFVFNSANTHNK